MADWSAFLQPASAIAGLILPAIGLAVANKGINAFQANTNIALTQQQIDAIHGLVNTGAGIIQTALAKGTMALHEVAVDSPKVQQVTQDAIAMAPALAHDAVTALGVTPEHTAKMIVAKVGNGIAADPTIPSVPALAVPPVAVTADNITVEKVA